VKFKDLYNSLLQEGPVPFAKIEQIKNKMAEQHSIPEGTFGVEYEYLPNTTSKEVEKDDILEALNGSWRGGRNRDLEAEYLSWLEEKRNDAAIQWKRYGRGDISRYDDSYGPMSQDTFTDVYAEPNLSAYNNEEDYERELKEYQEKLSDVDYNYAYWERRDKYDNTDEFFEYIADNNWEDFVEVEVDVDPEASCSEAINVLNKSISIKRDERYDPNMWTIGPDGPNTEIRSPILKRENMDQVDLVSAFVDHQITDSGTGLHIHIGVPKDFDAFDLLAMTTLVDEGQVESDLNASKVRRDLGFAKLRWEVSKNLIGVITRMKYGGKAQTKPFQMSNKELLETINSADRYAGTNIKAFAKYKTVEFRYFGAHNTKILPRWINYFLQLPAIAQKRNRIVLRDPLSGKKLYAIRMPGGVTQFELVETSQQPTIKPTGYPAPEIKKMPQTPSLKDKYKKP
jgi:hypothetical protein